MKAAVINASPLIILARAGYINLLPKMFSSIAVPRAVVSEIEAGPAEAGFGNLLDGAGWLSVVDVGSLASGPRTAGAGRNRGPRVCAHSPRDDRHSGRQGRATAGGGAGNSPDRNVGGAGRSSSGALCIRFCGVCREGDRRRSLYRRQDSGEARGKAPNAGRCRPLNPTNFYRYNRGAKLEHSRDELLAALKLKPSRTKLLARHEGRKMTLREEGQGKG